MVEGISVFLSLFDQPEVASLFCPPAPDAESGPPVAVLVRRNGHVRPVMELPRRLPPLADLIENGKVLALNMPAGANPALARAIGVLLKNAWMQALLRRPAEAARHPGRYLRPAVFICDEYQAFVTVGPGRPLRRRESVRAQAPVPLHPDRRHAVDPLARGVAHARPDAPHADLPVALRRGVRTDRVRVVRERHEDPGLLHVYRDHGQARVLVALRACRRRTRDHRREQVVPAAARAGVHAAHVLAAREVPSDLPALRRSQVAPGEARLPQAPLPAQGDRLLAAPRGGADMKRAGGTGQGPAKSAPATGQAAYPVRASNTQIVQSITMRNRMMARTKRSRRSRSRWGRFLTSTVRR